MISKYVTIYRVTDSSSYKECFCHLLNYGFFKFAIFYLQTELAPEVKQCFSNYNTHMNHQWIWLKCRVWFSRSETGSEILNFCKLHSGPGPYSD